jgi:hypothetical protein
MIDIKKSNKKELITEYYNILNNIWGKYSCDCLGYYTTAIFNKIVKLGGFI